MNGRNDFSAEWRIVPAWAWALAVIAFFCMQFVFHVVILHHEANPPGLGFRIPMGLFAGSVLAVYFLLLGYVNVDSGRRGMSRTLWTLIVALVSNGIGFLIYFLLRKPIQVKCPKCGNAAAADSTFCPKCGNQLRPTCANCGAAMQPGDAFCSRCGKTPAKAV